MNEEKIRQLKSNSETILTNLYSSYLGEKLGFDKDTEGSLKRHNGLRYKIARLKDKPWKVDRLSIPEKVRIQRVLKEEKSNKEIEEEVHGGLVICKDPIEDEYDDRELWRRECNIYSRNGSLLEQGLHCNGMRFYKNSLFLKNGFDSIFYYGDSPRLERSEIRGELIGDFSEGFGAFRIFSRWGHMLSSRDGKEVLDCTIYSGQGDKTLSPVHEGFSKITCDGCVDYIDMDGHFLFGKWEKREVGPTGDENTNYVLTEKTPYLDGGDFHEGYARVKKKGKWTLIDYEGKEVFKEPFDEVSDVKFGRVIVRNGFEKERYVYLGMGDYKVKKTLLGYECSDGESTYRLSCIPVKRIDNRYTLCTDKKKYYLYDILKKKYITVGKVDSVAYDGNLIYESETDTVYYVYDYGIVDITSYYMSEMMDKTHIFVKPVKGTINDMDDFLYMKFDELDEKKSDEYKKVNTLKEEEENKRRLEELKRKEEEKKKEEEDRRNKRKKYLETLKATIMGINETYSEEEKKAVKLAIPISFIKVDDHLEIPEEYLEVLKYIDLGLIDFTGVKLSGIDFRGCNIETVNPQVIYNKDLSGCNFEGVHFTATREISYNGVNIKGCKFSDDDNPITMDIAPEFFEDSIYDETTTYNGIPLGTLLKSRKR